MIRVLIISHNVISEYGNMGKTIKSFFEPLTNDVKLSQIYLSEDKPDDSICKNYFQVTDKEVLKNLLSIRSIGKEIYLTNNNFYVQKIKKPSVIKKNALFRLLRDVLWQVNFGDKNRLYKWIDKQSPDLIFLASGSQIFLINLAMKIKKIFNLPMITYVADNYRSDNDSIFTNPYQKLINYKLDYLLNNTDYFYAASNKMTDFFTSKYQSKGETYYRPIKISEYNSLLKPKQTSRAVYIGNLGLGRQMALIDLYNGLSKQGIAVDVFSSMKYKKEINALEKKGLNYLGEIAPDKVIEVYQEYPYIIHVESSKKSNIRKTKYSYSTKIPELLLSGRLILAYGPKSIASMEEFISNESAICLLDKNSLDRDIKEKVVDSSNNDLILKNAKKHLHKHNSYYWRERLLIVFNSLTNNWGQH